MPIRFIVPTLSLLVFFGAGCVTQKEIAEPSPAELPVKEAPSAGSCIPVEISPGVTTCVMSAPQDTSGPDDEVGKDETSEDTRPESDHEESTDPDPARE